MTQLKVTPEEVAQAFAECELSNGGWPPSMHEIAGRLHCAVSTVFNRCLEAEALGMLEARPAGPRGGRQGRSAYRASRKLLKKLAS